MANLYKLLSSVVKAGHYPPELDLSFYRLVHDDLAFMNDTELAEHYKTYGRSEGRMANPAAQRYGFIALIPPEATVLEVGPFNKPVFRGTNVAYFDVLGREDLMARASAHGQPAEGCPDIDYVSPTGNLGIVDKQFDIVFSSHCIEHQPDLVAHLKNVEKILRADGSYFIIAPDKRYCFDHFIPESSIDTVLTAHRENRKVHTFESIYQHFALTTHNDSAMHWAGRSEDPRAHLHDERAAEARAHFEAANGGYLDAHAWRFTPAGFRAIIDGLNSRGLTGFRCERVYETIHNNMEFGVILTKTR